MKAACIIYFWIACIPHLPHFQDQANAIYLRNLLNPSTKDDRLNVSKAPGSKWLSQLANLEALLLAICMRS